MKSPILVEGMRSIYIYCVKFRYKATLKVQDTQKIISAIQCRAARAMLGMSRGELATRSKVGLRTLVDFERGAREPYERTIRDVQAALEAAGVEFIFGDDGGHGVCLREHMNLGEVPHN